MGTWSNGGQDWAWQSSGSWSYQFWAAGQHLGTISNMSVSIFGDPQVDVNFSTFGGAVPSTFTFSSALLSFAPITGGTATATAGITVADINGDGSFINPVAPGQGMYQANFNGLVPAGVNYANFFPAPKFGAPGASDSDGLGPTVIPFAVTDMSAQFQFQLSANDLASGTSSFRIVPAPAGVFAVGFGLLAVGRRRR
jgi:hypothetical protein